MACVLERLELRCDGFVDFAPELLFLFPCGLVESSLGGVGKLGSILSQVV